MPATDSSAITPVADDEQAIRLLRSEWCNDGKVTGAAFQNRGPNSPRRIEISVFIQDRLPGQDGSVLHVEQFSDRGRIRLSAGAIRSVHYLSGGLPVPAEFDLSVTGVAEYPLKAYGNAHAHVSGPTHKDKAASALAKAFNDHGHMDRLPVQPIGPPPDSSQFR